MPFFAARRQLCSTANFIGSKKLLSIIALSAVISLDLLTPALALAAGAIPGYGVDGKPFTGTYPWLIIRCHADDENSEPQSTEYFKQFFTVRGKGTMNMDDWWHDVSFGQLGIDGTALATGSHADANGWYTLPISQAQYNKLSRASQVTACANAASVDENLGSYYGVLAIFPNTDIGASEGNADNYGPVGVSLPGINGKGGGIYTLALVNSPDNANATFLGHEMGHSFGLHHSRLLSTSTLGYGDRFDIMSAMGVYALKPPASDASNAIYGGSVLGSGAGVKGPGPDAITLSDEGWVPANRIAPAAVKTQQTIYLHALSDPDALTDSEAPTSYNNPDSGEDLYFYAPTQTSFPFSPPGTNCGNGSYVLEYREPIRWDAGIPVPASFWSPASPALQVEAGEANFPTGSVLLHLTCLSSWDPSPPLYQFSLLVNQEPQGGGQTFLHNKALYSPKAPAGAFYPGDEFASNSFNFHFAVNAMSSAKHEATITYSFTKGPIADKLALIGRSTTSAGNGFTVSATLTTDNAPNMDNAVVPGHEVVFTLENKTCQALTDLNGLASCDLQVVSTPLEKLTLGASAAATSAYQATSATTTVEFTPARVAAPPVPMLQKMPARPPAPMLPLGSGV